VLEAAKVSQAGFPKRIPFVEFVLHFMGADALRMNQRSYLPDRKKGKLAQAVAVKVLRLVAHRDFELGRTRIFLRRGAWETCMLRQRQLLRVIGPRVPGTCATGLRRARVMKTINRLCQICRTGTSSHEFRKVRHHSTLDATPCPHVDSRALTMRHL
jgi:myosin heavy subunit